MPSRLSLPRICIALGLNDVDRMLDHARREVEGGERFLEFRLDYLPRPELGIEAIRRFRAEHPGVTLLATCRRHQNHGRFNGSIEEQLKVLSAAMDAGAVAVDVEIESAENAVSKTEALRSKGQLIISYHNYESTPAMDAVLKRMLRVTGDAYKVVTTARKPSDVSRVLALAKAYPKVPLILLAMGEIGQPTRVLSTAFGGVYSYAAPQHAEGTAAGQMTARTLRNLYRVEKFTKAAKIYGVIADPVRHSISPHVHNRAYAARRMDAVYLPFLVAPAHLKDFMALADALPISGFSVTIPHKQKILRYLDVVDPLARRVGAVNTVWKKAGKWRGTNTDVEGVLGPLGKAVKISKAHVLVVGNGGAARGAAFALADAGAKLSITGRNIDRVRMLAKACGATPLSRDQSEKERFDAVVHATPLGMSPNVNECFFDSVIPGELVFDMVYNPLETELLRRAKANGKHCIDGLQMFLEQACKQFEIFTGEQPPRAQMEKAALEALTAKSTSVAQSA